MTKVEKFMYFLLYSLVCLLSLLPFRILYLLSDFTFLIMYRCAGYRRGVVRKNLRNSFPEKTDAERLQIERKFYHFLCDYIFETIKLVTMSPSKILRHVKYQGIEQVNEFITKGQSVAVYLAHYGNWEWVTSISLLLPENCFGGQVYHILESKVFDTLMLKIRSRMRSQNIERHQLLRKVVETRQKGTPMAIGFIADQGPEMHTIHHWINFFNQDTAVITGTETVAKKFDFACVYLDIKRERRGFYTIDIKLLTPSPGEYEDFKITELYFASLEQTIRRQPEIWLWSHNRWKRTKKQYEEYVASHPRAHN